jgi:hypothetical protein
MRRLIACVAKLYPWRWRERYGAEFDALMEDVDADWRELANVLGGALKMQLKSERAYWKLAATMAAIGAIVGLGVSLRVPERYTSSSTLRYSPAPQSDERQIDDVIARLTQEILSRHDLTYVAKQKGVFGAERPDMPQETVLAKMRAAIHIEQEPKSGPGARTVRISFAYPDKAKARAVAQFLTTHFVDSDGMRERYRVKIWQDVFGENAPPGTTLEVVVAPGDPSAGESPNRVPFLITGILAGALLAAVIWRPRAALQLGVYAAAACILAIGVSYLLPARYTSSAQMRMIPAIDGQRWFAGRTAEPVAGHIQRLANEVTSPDRLEKLIQRPSLNLYPKERAQMSIAEVARRMRERDLHIDFVAPSGVSLSFTYSDPKRAQALLREIITGMMEQNVIEARNLVKAQGPEFRKMNDYQVGEVLEVLDPASNPQTPDGLSPVAIAAAGFGAGLLIGAIVLVLRRPRGPAANAAVPVPAL